MAAVEQRRKDSPLEIQAKRREIIRLRCEGHTMQRVAEMVGLAGPSSVQHHEQAWLAEQTPSSEQTEQRRQMQLAGIDSVRARLFALLDAEVETPARLSVVDRLAKLWEREAKLVGLDMQQGVSVTMVTAEALASYLGWDDQAIEGSAVEITDGSANGV